MKKLNKKLIHAIEKIKAKESRAGKSKIEMSRLEITINESLSIIILSNKKKNFH